MPDLKAPLREAALIVKCTQQFTIASKFDLIAVIANHQAEIYPPLLYTRNALHGGGDTMRYRTCKTFDKPVSAVGFGVWTVSTPMWGITDDDQGICLLRHAFERGINCFDTADVYGDGKGETLLADALGAHRDEMVFCTKFGYDFYTHPGIQPGQRERPHNWSPAYVRRACEESLRRLRTDRIDLYQLHNPRLPALESDDLFAILEDLKNEGKILAYGAALGPALLPERQSREGHYLIERRHGAVQIIYNILEQSLGQVLCPHADWESVPVLVRVPHASGLLEGKFTADTTFATGDHRSFRMTTDEKRRTWLLDGLQKVERLRFAAEGAGRTMGQMAIQFVLNEPSVACVFPNIYDVAQVDEFAAAPDTNPLTKGELARISDLYARDFYQEGEEDAR